MSYVHDDFPGDMIAAIVMLLVLFSPLLVWLLYLDF